MREIKFRNEHSNKNGFYKYTYWKVDEETFLQEQGRGSYTNTYISAVQQFTGLQDKNGKDIYEGDRVGLLIEGEWLEGHQLTEDYWCPFTVYFEEGKFQCVWEDKNEPSMDLAEYWTNAELEITEKV